MATCDEITQSTLLGHPRITTEKFKTIHQTGPVRPDVKSQAKPAMAGSRPKGLNEKSKTKVKILVTSSTQWNYAITWQKSSHGCAERYNGNAIRSNKVKKSERNANTLALCV